MSQLPTIIVDSNQIARSDFYITGTPAWRDLGERSRAGVLRLVVPRVVVMEVVGIFRTDAETAAGQLRKLGLPLDVNELCLKYQAALEGALSDLGADTPADNCIDVATLIERATLRLRPFNSSGNGFRDTIVWAHAKSVLEDGCEVVLISRDGTFGSKKNGGLDLYPELAAELPDPSRISLYEGIQDYLASVPLGAREEAGIETSEVLTAIRTIINDDEAQVEANLAIALLSAATVVAGRDAVAVDIVEVGPWIDIDDVSVRHHPAQDGRFLATMDVFGDVVVDVEWPIDATISESHRAVKLLGVYMRVEATYDPHVERQVA